MGAIARKSSLKSKRTVSDQPQQTATQPEIRTRAYQIYLERKEAPGDAMSDWLRAEHELHSGAEQTDAATGRRQR